jgi:hypothetical protein
LKKRGIKVNKHDDLKGLHLPEIDRRLREMDLLNSIIYELDNSIRNTVENDEMAKLLDTIPGIAPYSTLYLPTMLDDLEGFRIPSRQLHILDWFHPYTNPVMFPIQAI